MSHSLQPHGLQHARLPCPSLPALTSLSGVCSNSCPLSWWCYPIISLSMLPLSSCLQSFPASVFSSESDLHIRWPKYWNFIFSINPSSEYSVLMSFRVGCFDIFAIQGTLKSFLQCHNWKASFCWHLWSNTYIWIDWFYLAVQGTLKSLVQHHSSKASILRCSAFLKIQLSHPYMTNGKTIALSRWTFVGQVMSLLLNMLSIWS